MDLFDVLLGFSETIIIIIAIIIVGIYVALSLFLSKFNKLLYGKGTWMAWVPFFDTYLLGKLTFNKLVGIILVIASVVLGRGLLGNFYSLIVFCLWIYAFIKYSDLKNATTERLRDEAMKCDSFSFGSGSTPPPYDGGSTYNPNPPEGATTEENPPGTKNCPGCGAVQNNGANFCTNCGQKI